MVRNKDKGVFKEQERVIADNALVGKGMYRSEQIMKLKDYSEAIGEDDAKDFIGFGDGRVGIWKPDAENPHGLEFGMMAAVNYLRCHPEKIRLSKLLTSSAELKGVDFVISPWEVLDLEMYGFQEIASENFVYVYQKQKKEESTAE